MDELTGFLALAYTSLLAIINPLGAVPLFLAITATHDHQQRRRTLLRAIVTALVVLLAFATLGMDGVGWPAIRIR